MYQSMKLLAVADIHGSQYRLNLVLNNIEKYQPDLVVICGDITQFGPAEVAINFLNQIPVTTLAIPGNIDTVDVSSGISKSNADNIHLCALEKRGLSFIGIGGEITTPLDDISIQIDGMKKPLKESITNNTILVTHVPPYETQDKVFLGKYIGSKDLRALIDTYKPRLVLSGHVHEDPGVTELDSTIVVNCSLGKRTEGALIILNDHIEVTILD